MATPLETGVPAFANPPGPPAPAWTPYEIPLNPLLPQRIAVTLAGERYALTVSWCDPAQIWTLEIDDVSGNRLLGGLALVTGLDLLAPYPYLGIGGALVAQTDYDMSLPPSLTNLGRQGHLYFVVPN